MNTQEPNEIMTVQIFWDDLTDEAKEHLRNAFTSHNLGSPDGLWIKLPLAIIDFDITDMMQYGVYFERSFGNESRTSTD